MRNEQVFPPQNQLLMRLSALGNVGARRVMVGVILMISLAAFEMFNFDTTQYALRDLLGDVDFLGLKWASILAIAFCSIDFAGLIRLFTPQRGAEEPKEVWYLMGAWLLGATMNAIMTWWAVSLTLLNHSFGNEVLSREELLNSVPIFVAVLVWLTRILFIGAFTVAGDHIFDFSGERMQPSQAALSGAVPAGRPARMPARAAQSLPPQPLRGQPQPLRSQSPQAQPMQAQPVSQVINRQRQTPPPPPEPLISYDPFEQMEPPAPLPATPGMPQRQNSRVRQRPPRPNGEIRRVPASIHASPRQ